MELKELLYIKHGLQLQNQTPSFIFRHYIVLRNGVKGSQKAIQPLKINKTTIYYRPAKLFWDDGFLLLWPGGPVLKKVSFYCMPDIHCREYKLGDVGISGNSISLLSLDLANIQLMSTYLEVESIRCETMVGINTSLVVEVEEKILQMLVLSLSLYIC